METTTHIENRAFAKISFRLLPLLTLAYILNYLDRNNIGFAALTMNQDLGLTPTQFGTGAGILFLSYSLFEIPSNIAMYHFGARRWIARIMIMWGIVSAATIFVIGPKSWYALRLLLGISEAGFFPGITFYIASWFPAESRTRMLSWFVLGIPVSSMLGGPISGLLLGMNGVWGLAGWKWLFLLEGLPTVVLGIAALWVLADSPEKARWLTQEERVVVRSKLSSEKREKEMTRLLPAFTDLRVLTLAFLQLGFTAGSYGVGIWLPQIIKTSDLSNLAVGLITGACYALASAGMIAWSAYVDRTGKKINNLMAACFIAALAFVLAVYVKNSWVSLGWITVALIAVTAARAIFWSIPTRFMSGLGAAGGLAFINSIGTLGGFLGPFTIGVLKTRTHSFSVGLLAMALCLLGAGVLSWSLKLIIKEE
jgi:ACS family tartrate transporter-like MFS transporter